MHRHARLLPLLAVCLLAPVATAHAECGWVLWVHDTLENFAENKRGERWNPAEASTSEAGCAGKLKGRLAWTERTLEEGSAKVPKDEEMHFKIIEGRTVSLNFYRKTASVGDIPVRTQTITYVCLPDTVDPRGPKGT
jgi:hypothetical protein